MVTRPVAFVKMAVAAQVQQVEFINQTLALQKIESAVNRNAVKFFTSFFFNIAV